MAFRPSFTLGIEEEFQVVDPETRELKSHIAELFAEADIALYDAKAAGRNRVHLIGDEKQGLAA